MAVLKSFNKVLKFIKKIPNHPFVKYQIERSNLKVEDIKDYETFKQIKPLTRKELATISADFKNFVSLFETCPHKIFESPGGIFNLLFDKFEQYRFYKALETANFSNCDIVVNTFSYHLTPAGYMFDEAIEKLGGTTVPAGPITSDKCAEIVLKTHATAFIGTKTFLKKVLNKLGEKNTLIKAYLIAEKITDEERKELSQKFNIEIYQGYGTAEVGLIASECYAKDGMHLDDAIFAEFLKLDYSDTAKENETCEVVVTLLNENYPLLRYATGDLSAYTTKQCQCGREDVRLLGIFGRTDSSVKVKGVFIHKWQFDEFCDKNMLRAKLYIKTDENRFDYLILEINRNANNIHEKFKNYFKLNVKDVIINSEIKDNEIIDERKYLKDK